MRVKLTVAYKGTNYCGYQIQPSAPTIEGELNKALTDLFGQPITVTGASRTDAGVHALGNVAVFDVDTRMPASRISYALNQRLPKDIVVVNSCEVKDTFHPRKNVLNKTYEYKILNQEFPNPLLSDTTYHYYYNLDIDKMNEAAAYLVGEHDFTSFCCIKTQAESHVRTIYSLNVSKEGNVVTIRVTGSGFLYNMVRIIAGTLLEVGGGKREASSIKASIEALDRAAAGPTAPGHALTLVEIKYL